VSAGRTYCDRLAPWLLLSPFLFLFAVFSAYPLGRATLLACQQTFGPGTARMVGFDNFRFLLRDDLFWTAARNTAIFTCGSVLIQLPLALGLALLLNRDRLRGRAIYRAIFFAPSLVGVVFVAMIFALLFEKRTGLINRSLHGLAGFDLEFPWLETHVMWALILASLWQYVGFNMVYFLAALLATVHACDHAGHSPDRGVRRPALDHR
jgi:ABC-type sugar transport system permease subunit